MLSPQNSLFLEGIVMSFEAPPLLSCECGVQLIGLSSLVMIETKFYESCALTETERCSWKNGRLRGGHCNGPFIPSWQSQPSCECLASNGIKESKMSFQYPDQQYVFLSYLYCQIGLASFRNTFLFFANSLAVFCFKINTDRTEYIL